MRAICMLGGLLITSPQLLLAEETGRTSPPEKAPAEAVSNEVNYVSWVYPVSLKQDSGKDAETLAKRLSKSLGVGGFGAGGVHITDQSIGCCFWIDVANWRPNPGDPGYVILIQPGGAQLQATDVRQLEFAVARIEKSIIVKDGRPHVPVGLMTNYPVLTTGLEAGPARPKANRSPMSK